MCEFGNRYDPSWKVRANDRCSWLMEIAHSLRKTPAGLSSKRVGLIR